MTPVFHTSKPYGAGIPDAACRTSRIVGLTETRCHSFQQNEYMDSNGLRSRVAILWTLWIFFSFGSQTVDFMKTNDC